MTSLFEFVSLPNKFNILDTERSNKDSILGKTSIDIGGRNDSALLTIIAILLFKRAKPLPGRKKTWLGAKPEVLDAKKEQISSLMVNKAESLAAIKKEAAI